MLLDDFITYIRAEKRYSEHTVSGYGRDVERFMEFLCGLSDRNRDDFFALSSCDGGFDPSMVTPEDIRGWIISLTESGLSPTSVNRMSSSLRAFFRWLRKTGQVEKDPFRRISFQKTPSRLPGYIPETSMDSFVGELECQHEGGGFAQQRDSLIIILFYTTGIRLGELADIRLGDFSADFCELKVRGKGNKERIVPLIGYTRRKISDYMVKIKEENICISEENSLFLTEKGKPVSRTGIYRMVKRELAAAGIQGKRSPHILRHTFATHMLNEGADIREIQELLGHNSLAATQVYTHNSIAKLKEVYDSAHPRASKRVGDEQK